MNHLQNLINLTEQEKVARGLVYTPREIAQQPETWKSTFKIFQQRAEEIREFLISAGVTSDPRSRPIVYLIGAGTSDYVGESLVYLLRQMWQCEVLAVPSTDLLPNFDDHVLPERKYLWISFSRSGESPEGVAVLERALEAYPNISHIVVSCNANGRMARNTNLARVLTVVLDDAVNDRSLAMTSSFTNMVIFGQCLAHAWTESKYESIFHQLTNAGEKFLEISAECAATLSKRPYTNACFVGTGSLASVAKESSLKLLELTAGRVRTMSTSTLGLRHGPMAALNKDTLFVCYLSTQKDRRQYEEDLLREISRKRISGCRVAVGLTLDASDEPLADFLLTPGPGFAMEDSYRPPLDVIFGQLLGLYFSIANGIHPDTPSPDGVISRVVPSIGMHR